MMKKLQILHFTISDHVKIFLQCLSQFPSWCQVNILWLLAETASNLGLSYHRYSVIFTEEQRLNPFQE